MAQAREHARHGSSSPQHIDGHRRWEHDGAVRSAFEHDDYFAVVQYDAAAYVIYAERLSANKIANMAMTIIWDYYT